MTAEKNTFQVSSGFSVSRICAIIRQLPAGYRVTIQPPRRTLDQNAKLHAMLRDIIAQHPVAYDDHALDLDDWKQALLSASGQKVRFLPNPFDGSVMGIAPKTSRLTVAQCSDLIEQLYAKGAEWNIEWSEPDLWGHNERRVA